MIRILISGFTSNFGGVEKFVMNYYNHIDRNQIQMDFITEAEHPAYEDIIAKNGGHIWYIPARSKNPIKFYNSIYRFYQQHASEYDVFWCNKCMLNNITLLILAKRFDIPTRIIHSHNSASMDTGVKGKLMHIMHVFNKRRISKYATDFWACSDFAARWFFNTDMIHSSKYRFIPNAVDTTEFQYNAVIRQKYREKLKLNNEFLIGHVGRFNYQKNHEFLVDIFNEIHKKEKDTVLLLIGVGELEPVIKDKVEQLGLNHYVKFLGQSSEVGDWMQAMDCFLLPSRFEGLPVVAIEAQAAGLPVIASSNGITPQTKLIDDFIFLSLDDKKEVWADMVLKQRQKCRMNTTNQIKKRGFEIITASERLQNLFLQRRVVSGGKNA